MKIYCLQRIPIVAKALALESAKKEVYLQRMQITDTTQRRFISNAYLCLVCILAFLGGFCFLGTRGAWFLALGTLVFIKQFFAKRIRFELSFVLVIVFATMLFVSYAVYSSFSFVYLVAYLIVPIAMFMLGRESFNSRKELMLVVVALALGHTAYAGGIIVFTLQKGVSIDPANGIPAYYSFWNDAYLPRTLFPIDTAIALALGTALLFDSGQTKRWWPRLLGVVLVIGYLASSNWLGVRSPIITVPSVLGIVGVFSVLKESNRRTKILRSSILGGFVGLFLLFWFLVLQNVFGIRDFLMTIPGFNRFISSEGSDPVRINQYRIFFDNWLNYPWGGMFQANLLGEDPYSGVMYFHNLFLQIYTHGGVMLSLISILSLFLFGYQTISIKPASETKLFLTLAFSIVISIFVIGMIEPMITSAPFISSYLFLAGGYLTGQLAKQKQKKPLFVFGLNDWQEDTSLSKRSLMKLILFVLFGILGGVLVSLTSGSQFYAILMLAVSALAFLLFDKNQYNVVSWIKTAISFAFATGIILLEFYLLPNPSLLFSIAKVMIGFFGFLLVRIIIIQKRDPEDGYRAIRNMIIRISKDASLPEENLVD